MKKYILLDWDGNLAQTLDLWLDAFRVVLEARGIDKTDDEIGLSFGQAHHYLGIWGVEDVENAIIEADSIAKKKLPSVELYPAALEVLEVLKQQKKKLALITTSPHENILHLLEKHSLSDMFDVVIAGDDVVNHKPHPEPLEVALERLGGNKKEAVMIGDSDKDLGAAKNAGIDSILFYPPEHKKFYELRKLQNLDPTHVVEDFRQVIDLVN